MQSAKASTLFKPRIARPHTVNHIMANIVLIERELYGLNTISMMKIAMGMAIKINLLNMA